MYAFVQQTSVAQTSAGSSASTANFPSSITAGNTLAWVVMKNYGETQTLGLVDTQGNTFNQVSSYDDTTTNGYQLFWGYATITSGGSDALTASLSGAANNLFIYAAEYSGIDTTAPFHSGEVANSVNTYNPGGTDSCTSGNTPTLAIQPAMLWGFNANVYDTTASAAGTGFTGQAAVWTQFSGVAEDKRLVSTSAVAATFTPGAAGRAYYTLAMVLKESGASAAFIPNMPYAFQPTMAQ